MIVDPKFANIPWIAHDEPDVYESEDLPESDQRKPEGIDDEQVLPKEIEKVNLSAANARKRFEHCKVDASKADFSDFISGSRRIGYAVENAHYESYPDGTPESSLTSRFQRLQAEVRQLADDAENVKKEAASADAGLLSAEQLSTLATSLTEQLGAIQMEEIFGPNANVADLCSQDAIVQKRLLEQIQNFKPKSKAVDSNTSDHITYDLYSKPSDQSDAVQKKTLELDRRLQRLEALLGGTSEATVSSSGGLIETANRLSERTSMLEPAHLDQAEARLTALQSKLASVKEAGGASSTMADADVQNRISELYDIVKKWDTFSSNLPQIVDRLVDLKTLHERASEFSNSLVNMESAQKKIDQQLSGYGTLLQQVQESFTDTLSTIKENVAVLEKAAKST